MLGFENMTSNKTWFLSSQSLRGEGWGEGQMNGPLGCQGSGCAGGGTGLALRWTQKLPCEGPRWAHGWSGSAPGLPAPFFVLSLHKRGRPAEKQSPALLWIVVPLGGTMVPPGGSSWEVKVWG